MYTERLDEHDNFFIPKTESEKVLWESLRDSAKAQMNMLITSRENGKKGGRPAQQKKEIPVKLEPKTQVRGAFIPPTLEEVLKYAEERCELPAWAGGFECSKDMVVDFFNQYDRQGWMLGNGIHMTNWQSALKKWCANEIKNTK